MSNNHPGPAIFFYVNRKILLHSCPLSKGEPYRDFIVYPLSHFTVWEKKYAEKYGVDFGYYPRGRIVYRKTDDTYLIYYDKCMEPVIGVILKKYAFVNTVLSYDEHYQCHNCNRGEFNM